MGLKREDLPFGRLFGHLVTEKFELEIDGVSI